MDRGKAGGTLDAWLSLPWPGPTDVVLPGFHSAAETGLKRGSNGDEIFFALCGLMASGSRSILLSRWPVAGQSAFDLTREYVQELPFVSASEAWQRSVQLARSNPIAAELEPRLSTAGGPVELTADHPFFWAGYLLADLGRASPAPPAVPPAPAAGKPPAEAKPAAEAKPLPAAKPIPAAKPPEKTKTTRRRLAANTIVAEFARSQPASFAGSEFSRMQRPYQNNQRFFLNAAKALSCVSWICSSLWSPVAVNTSLM